jgi:hypothetical protein
MGTYCVSTCVRDRRIRVDDAFTVVVLESLHELPIVLLRLVRTLAHKAFHAQLKPTQVAHIRILVDDGDLEKRKRTIAAVRTALAKR